MLVSAHLAALMPTPANARQISEGLAQTMNLHKLLLQKLTGHMEIIHTFPHFLSYEGEMVSSFL